MYIPKNLSIFSLLLLTILSIRHPSSVIFQIRQRQQKMLGTIDILGGIGSVIFASTLGIGVLFSAASVFVYQGFTTLNKKGR
jgi:uncharacterized membrane protein YqgA involved in biofilm formation